MSLVESTIRAQIRQTENLINVAGRDIQLRRPGVLIDDGAGGKQRAGDPKVFRPVRRYFGGLTTEGRGATTRPEQWITTSLGDKYREFFILIGLPGDDIQPGDFFLINGEQYDVLFGHGDVDQYQAKYTVGLVR